MDDATLPARLERLTRDANKPEMAQERTGWDVVYVPGKGLCLVKRRGNG